MNGIEQRRALRRIRWLVGLFIAGLVLSGATAIPLESEVTWLAKVTGAHELLDQSSPPAWALWLCRVEAALHEINLKHPFISYGGDWLAFGHFAIAIAFIGAWRDPVRNRWLFDFGLTACALVIPYALTFGALRGIPFWWRLIDCSFGLLGAAPLWLARRWVNKLRSQE
ncbi:MAG TPA: hypothetical protein VFT34_07730 [Verrucomicrobiae bacterium]|nr:hypothetical protein [Verrucomicrobiae bacterium]